MQLQKHVYWSDFQKSNYSVKNHDPTSPNRQDTDVFKHLTDNPDHEIDFDKTEIMAQTNHWRKLLITQTLLIQKHNPNLNVDKTSILLYLFYTKNSLRC